MDKNRINDMVDRKILDYFREGVSISAVQSELKIRIKNFTTTITKDGTKIEDIYNKEFSDISIIRHRYGITYIKQCEKRIKDLDWILNKKSQFRHLTNSKIFNLIKFKEKITTENVI